MSKPEAYPVQQPPGASQPSAPKGSLPEPYTGSQQVRKQQHSGQRHGEGS